MRLIKRAICFIVVTLLLTGCPGKQIIDNEITGQWIVDTCTESIQICQLDITVGNLPQSWIIVLNQHLDSSARADAMRKVSYNHYEAFLGNGSVVQVYLLNGRLHLGAPYSPSRFYIKKR